MFPRLISRLLSLAPALLPCMISACTFTIGRSIGHGLPTYTISTTPMKAFPVSPKISSLYFILIFMWVGLWRCAKLNLLVLRNRQLHNGESARLSDMFAARLEVDNKQGRRSVVCRRRSVGGNGPSPDRGRRLCGDTKRQAVICREDHPGSPGIASG